MTNILNCKRLDEVTQEFTSIVKKLQYKHSKYTNITKYSKAWWNKECNRDLVTYQISRKRLDWIKYMKMVKMAKQIFFNNKIQEITSTNKIPWNLMNQVKKQKLPAIEAIKFNSYPCNNLNDL